jgi:vitamin B12 transporter
VHRATGCAEGRWWRRRSECLQARRHLLGLSACLTGLLAAATSGPAAAAAPDPQAASPESGNVTRVRGPSEPADQLIPRDVLRRHAVADLGQVLSAEPGLRVVRLGGLGAFATLAIRGGTAEQVAVILDGIPLNGADGAPVDLGTLPLGPLASVALHRGFLPARYGVPTLGGGLVLRTLAPPSDGVAGEAEVAAGSFGTAQVRAQAGASGLALHVEHFGSAGDFTYLDDRGTRFLPGDDALRTRRNNGAALTSVLARAASSPLRGLEVRALHLTTASDRGLPGLGVHPTTTSALTMARHVTGLSARAGREGGAELQLAAWHVLSRSSWRDPLGELGPPMVAPRTVSTASPGATLTVASPLGASLRGGLHLAWRGEDLASDGRAPRHLLTAGLSAAAEAGPLTLSAESQLLLAPRATDDQTALGDAHRLALSLPLGAGQTLGLTLTRTFRLPSLHERFGATGLVLGNPDLRPERGHGLEAAWRGDFASAEGLPRLTVALHAFARWHDDLIQFVQNAQNVARPENVASARLIGAELDLGLRPLPALETRLVATVLDARDTSDIAARRGRLLPLRPQLTAGLRASLREELASAPSSGAAPGAASAPSSGSAPDDHVAIGLEADLMTANPLDPANLVMTSPRLLLGVSGRVRRGSVTVVLSIHNLLGSAVQDLAGFPLPGLSAFASLRYTP